MKKIVALLLSVMMLLGMAAFAEEVQETALVTCFSNIVFETTANGETVSRNLDGFEAYISLDTADGLSLVGQAFNGDESLLLAVAKIVGDTVQIGIDGVDKTFVAESPQLAGQDTSSLGETVRESLPALLNLQLPPVNVGSLPKLDLVSLAGIFGTDAGDGTVTFSIPYQMIDSLLDQVVEIAKTSGESVPGLDQALAAIEQLRAAGMSVSLDGVVADEGDQQTASISLYLVSEGQVSDTAAVVLNLATAQDSLVVSLDVPNGDEVMTIGNLEILTDTSTSTLTAELDIAGMMQFSFAMYQEDGLQKAALTMDSMFQANFAVTVTYGKSGDDDLLDITFAIGDEVGVEIVSTTAVDSEASRAGKLDVTFASEGNVIHVSADIEEFLGSVDLGDYTLPETTAPVDEISSEENSAALQNALAPLIQYFAEVFTDTAA